jgi:hypothetical protein
MYATALCNLHYAVIEARWTGRPAERFAVAYYSEESLRELIAGPNIIGSGFNSRQEALALIANSVIAAPNPAWRTEAVCESKENRSSAYPGPANLHNRISLQRIWTIPSGLIQQVAAAFVLIVCSKNVFSMALRAFMCI